MRCRRNELLFAGVFLLSLACLPLIGAEEEVDTPAKLLKAALARSPFRILEAPEGATYHGSGSSGGSGDHDEWYQRIGTDLSAVKVLRHYGGQLEERGWAFGTETIEWSVALQTFRFEDEEGQPWHVLLFASEEVMMPGRVQILLRQTRLVAE
jgi:hypothetical protein